MIGNNDILTQEEIKSLIELSHNRADLDKLASSPIITDRNYTTYDFTNPFTISKGQHQAFEALHIEMIRDIAYELSANLRKRANIEIKKKELIRIIKNKFFIWRFPKKIKTILAVFY